MWIGAVAVLALICYWLSMFFASRKPSCTLCESRDRYCGACAAKATQRLMKDNRFRETS